MKHRIVIVALVLGTGAGLLAACQSPAPAAPAATSAPAAPAATAAPAKPQTTAASGGSVGGIDLLPWPKVDFAKYGPVERKELGRVTLPEVPPGERHTEGLQGSPSHGIGVAPDGKTLWVNSKVNNHVYAYSLPDLRLLGGVRVGEHPDWLTFTPDSKRVYVANAGSNSVSVALCSLALC